MSEKVTCIKIKSFIKYISSHIHIPLSSHMSHDSETASTSGTTTTAKSHMLNQIMSFAKSAWTNLNEQSEPTIQTAIDCGCADLDFSVEIRPKIPIWFAKDRADSPKRHSSKQRHRSKNEKYEDDQSEASKDQAKGKKTYNKPLSKRTHKNSL